MKIIKLIQKDEFKDKPVKLLVHANMFHFYLSQFPCFAEDLEYFGFEETLMAYQTNQLPQECELVAELLFDLLTDTYFDTSLKGLFQVLEGDDLTAALNLLQFHQKHIEAVHAGVFPEPGERN